jgi:hypothetical protein
MLGKTLLRFSFVLVAWDDGKTWVRLPSGGPMGKSANAGDACRISSNTRAMFILLYWHKIGCKIYRKLHSAIQYIS